MKRRLGHTDLEIAPLVFGTNVIGWTVDEETSFHLLDAFVAEGLRHWIRRIPILGGPPATTAKAKRSSGAG